MAAPTSADALLPRLTLSARGQLARPQPGYAGLGSARQLPGYVDGAAAMPCSWFFLFGKLKYSFFRLCGINKMKLKIATDKGMDVTQSRKPANNVTYIHTGGLRVPNAAVRTAATATVPSYPRVDTRLALTCPHTPSPDLHPLGETRHSGLVLSCFECQVHGVGGGGGRGRGRSRNGCGKGGGRAKEISGEKRRKRTRSWRRRLWSGSKTKRRKEAVRGKKQETEKLQKGKKEHEQIQEVEEGKGSRGTAEGRREGWRGKGREGERREGGRPAPASA